MTRSWYIVQVSFPDPEMPNCAVVKSTSTAGKEHVVRNIYSNFPSCDCEWADQGNMCKHQIKALLMRGHEGGLIVQQLGTRFGSEMGGMSHLDSNLNVALVASEPPYPNTNPAIDSVQVGFIIIFPYISFNYAYNCQVSITISFFLTANSLTSAIGV